MERSFMFSLEQDHVEDRGLRNTIQHAKEDKNEWGLLSRSMTISHLYPDLRTTLYLQQLISNKVSSARRYRVKDYWKKGRRTGMIELE